MLEFNEMYATEKCPCTVYFKGILIFTIRYDKHENKFWICPNSAINFQYYNSKDDLDFVKPYKYASSLYDAKKNCKHIMYTYINWLTEK